MRINVTSKVINNFFMDYSSAHEFLLYAEKLSILNNLFTFLGNTDSYSLIYKTGIEINLRIGTNVNIRFHSKKHDHGSRVGLTPECFISQA